MVEIGKQYEIDIDARSGKENVKAILITNLVEKGVLIIKPPVSLPGVVPLPPELTFEQHKELLLLQIEHDKFKIKAELETEQTRQEIE